MSAMQSDKNEPIRITESRFVGGALLRLITKDFDSVTHWLPSLREKKNRDAWSQVIAAPENAYTKENRNQDWRTIISCENTGLSITCTYKDALNPPTLGPVHTTAEEFETHQIFSVHTTPNHRSFWFCFWGKSHDYRDTFVFEKLRFSWRISLDGRSN